MSYYPTISVYLAAKFVRQPEMRANAAELRSLGYDCNPAWLGEAHDLPVDAPPDDPRGQKFALDDWLDLSQAEIVVCFTEPPGDLKGRGRGGRHVEMGMALAWGKTSPRSFATFDPDSYSWRTSQASLLEEWAPWSRTWPQAGMTRSGTAYRLRPSAPRTYALASSYWPTPVASEAKRGDTTPYSQGGYSLSFALGGRPNPRWVEWLMGFPPGWSSLALAMPSSPESPKSLGGKS